MKLSVGLLHLHGGEGGGKTSAVLGLHSPRVGEPAGCLQSTRGRVVGLAPQLLGGSNGEAGRSRKRLDGRLKRRSRGQNQDWIRDLDPLSVDPPTPQD